MEELDFEVRPEVLTYEDIRKMVPKLDGHEKLVNRVLHILKVDEVNATHARICDTPGPDFVRRLLFEEFQMTLRVDNEEVLDRFPEGAFITVSNHPFGSIDGIALIYLVSKRRPKFKVMVNMILNYISAMRPNMIAVDAWHSDDPAKRAVSVNGIRQTLAQLKAGEPVGFFPAGAMSNTNWKGQPIDKEWQKSVLQIIYKSKVPVIPIFFHGKNSWMSNLLGHIWWVGRSLRMPREMFNKKGKELHISVGEPIMPADQEVYRESPEILGAYLREKTYELRDKYKK